MTDETETPRTDEEAAASTDDKRFEVKWRKKNEPTPRSAEPAEPQLAGSEETDVATLQQELESERQRVKDLQDRWQRAAADLANLRRRTEQERGEVEKFASMLLVQQLLPVLDNFDRALTTIPGNLQMLTWIQGVMLIERHLRAILEQQGVAAIDSKDQPFNAHYHEAIGERETDEVAPDTVVQEYQKGYTMHGAVIRPALVEVARAKSSSVKADEEPAESTDQETGEPVTQEAESENVGP